MVDRRRRRQWNLHPTAAHWSVHPLRWSIPLKRKCVFDSQTVVGFAHRVWFLMWLFQSPSVPVPPAEHQSTRVGGIYFSCLNYARRFYWGVAQPPHTRSFICRSWVLSKSPCRESSDLLSRSIDDVCSRNRFNSSSSNLMSRSRLATRASWIKRKRSMTLSEWDPMTSTGFLLVLPLLTHPESVANICYIRLPNTCKWIILFKPGRYFGNFFTKCSQELRRKLLIKTVTSTANATTANTSDTESVRRSHPVSQETTNDLLPGLRKPFSILPMVTARELPKFTVRKSSYASSG